MVFHLTINNSSSWDKCDKCGKPPSEDDPIVLISCHNRYERHVICVHASHITRAFAKYNKAVGKLVIL